MAIPLGLAVAGNQPCLILLKDEGDELTLSVANPENKATTISVDIRRENEAGDSAELQVVFQMPSGIEAGRSVTRKVTLR